MSKKANPTLIGGFVLGSVALIVAAVAIFGSGKFFTHRPRAVVFFQGNIQGLSVGSPVNLRGVVVGSVSDIDLDLDVKTMQPVIPVYLEFDPRHLHILGDVTAAELGRQQPLRTAIANGLHARLAIQSLITGQLGVELDLDPNEPRRLVGADPKTIEIPSAESDIEKLKNVLMGLPLEDIANSLLKLLQDADRLATSGDVSTMLRSLATASDNFNALTGLMRNDLPALLAEVRGAAGDSREFLETANSAIVELRTALKSANGLLTGDGREALSSAARALQAAQKTLANIDSLVAQNSAQRADLDELLRNLTVASRSLRIFAEDIQRRPNAIIVGK